jgi:adenylylsulfate kinase
LSAGVVVWFTGLPSSGKTSLAKAVGERIRAEGTTCCLLDSDVIREALRPDLGYEQKDRDELYDMLGGLSALLAGQGLIVLTAATAPLRKNRERARREAPAFVEVYVSTPLAECERRDAKGLYARARKGEIRDFPGISAAYEEPTAPDVVAPGGLSDEAAAAVRLAIAEVTE